MEICQEALELMRERPPHISDDPRYFRIAVEATMNLPLKLQYLQEGIKRFATLGRYDVCAEFSRSLGNTDLAERFQGMAYHASEHIQRAPDNTKI